LNEISARNRIAAGLIGRLHIAVAVLVLLSSSGRLSAYSVLTHEEIVDLLWVSEIKPLLLERFPTLTEAELREAHAYAYGGSVIQDIGYYPFGDKKFSNFVHYVRSGDFVTELIRQSRDADEYAFALGALSHYAADVSGHPAVNEAVAIAYPKLRAKYGRSVRYAQDKTAQLKTEFGFDTYQVSRNRYGSPQYHDFIGFKVSAPLIERTFPLVYGLQLQDVLKNENLAIGSYRFFISRLIPQMTQVALATHKKDLISETPDFAKQKFLYRLSRADYEREWGKAYTKPGLGTRILATILRIVPKIGPFKSLGFNNPTPKTEDLYIKSIDATTDHYRDFLEQVRLHNVVLPNYDLDTGNVTGAAEYSLADDAYADLLAELSAGQFNKTSPQLRTNILTFYSDLSQPIETRKDATRWQEVVVNIGRLKSASLPALTVSNSAE